MPEGPRPRARVGEDQVEGVVDPGAARPPCRRTSAQLDLVALAAQQARSSASWMACLVFDDQDSRVRHPESAPRSPFDAALGEGEQTNSVARVGLGVHLDAAHRGRPRASCVMARPEARAVGLRGVEGIEELRAASVRVDAPARCRARAPRPRCRRGSRPSRPRCAGCRCRSLQRVERVAHQVDDHAAQLLRIAAQRPSVSNWRVISTRTPERSRRSGRSPAPSRWTSAICTVWLRISSSRARSAASARPTSPRARALRGPRARTPRSRRPPGPRSICCTRLFAAVIGLRISCAIEAESCSSERERARLRAPDARRSTVRVDRLTDLLREPSFSRRPGSIITRVEACGPASCHRVDQRQITPSQANDRPASSTVDDQPVLHQPRR